MERDALWRRVVDTRFGSMFIYLFIFFFLGGGCFVALIVCRDLMGFVFGRISDSGWGGTIFIVLSSLRCGMVLLLKFGMILGVGGFL